MVTAASVTTEPAHGGRWTSLCLGGREWLWRRADVAREAVRPGDPFVDAGGLEECIPTVRGTPDHGLAWSRPWAVTDGGEVADCGAFVLHRQVRAGQDEVVARYRLTAEPGYRFLWAAHALLDLAVGASVELPDGLPVRLYPEAGELIGGWPADTSYVTAEWPAPYGVPLAELGPDDGTAVGASVLDVDTVTVVDGDARLHMKLVSDAPHSVALWRNLGGFPAGSPYRSVGVEPMLGRVLDLADARPDDAVTVPSSGVVEWELEVTGGS